MKRLLEWQLGTLKAIRPETANVKTLTLTLPDWSPHRPSYAHSMEEQCV